MICGGIDLGGTKIEAQVFDGAFALQERRRWETPKSYPALIEALTGAIAFCEAQGGPGCPVGISACGLINETTGLALTANLPATGRPLPGDVMRAAGRRVSWINDCRALALSEASLGAGRDLDPVVGLVFGTGVAGGVVSRGKLMAGGLGVGGEFGHFALPAGPILRHGLPLLPCGCGRQGCAETYLSGPGLTRICAHVTGQSLAPREILAARHRDGALAQVWSIWLDLACEFLMTLCLTIGPRVIVLGGGLSQAEGLCPDLAARLRAAMFRDFPIPEIRLAQGGDASGARGAAIAARQESLHV